MLAVREVKELVKARVIVLLVKATERFRRNKGPGEIELVEPLLSDEERGKMNGDAGSRTIFTKLGRGRHPCIPALPAVREFTDRKGNKKVEPVKTGKEAEAPTICMSAIEKGVEEG